MQARKRLAVLDAATSLNDLRAINYQWRICFRWPRGTLGPSAVEIVGGLSRITKLLDEAESIASDLGDGRRQTIVLMFMAKHYYEMANLERAAAYAERALRIAGGLGDPALEATAEVHRGRVLYGLGEYCQAIDLLERAAKALRKHPLEPCFGGHSTGLPFLVRALVEI